MGHLTGADPWDDRLPQEGSDILKLVVYFHKMHKKLTKCVTPECLNCYLICPKALAAGAGPQTSLWERCKLPQLGLGPSHLHVMDFVTMLGKTVLYMRRTNRNKSMSF